jgi:hypothetical protein
VTTSKNELARGRVRRAAAGLLIGHWRLPVGLLSVMACLVAGGLMGAAAPALADGPQINPLATQSWSPTSPTTLTPVTVTFTLTGCGNGNTNAPEMASAIGSGGGFTNVSNVALSPVLSNNGDTATATLDLGLLAAGSYSVAFYGGYACWPTMTGDSYPQSTPTTLTVAAPATAPSTPAAPVASTYSDGSVALAWTAPANNGAAITSYTIAPSPACASCTGLSVSGSPAATSTSITGLSAGTPYTFTVTATNTAGDSSASPASNAVTPWLATNVALSASTGNPIVGQAITYTATVTPAPDGGTVAFTDHGITILSCAAQPITPITGLAACQITYAAAGSHTIGASYSGTDDQAYAASATASTTSVSVTAAPVPTPSLAVTAAPAISGTASVGQALSCGQGSWTGNPTGFSYQWSRDGAAISGGAAASYTVQTADEGHTLTCTVTASRADGSSQSTSGGVQVPNPSGGVQVPNPSVAACPAPTGTLAGTKLGLLTLGETRQHARQALPRFAVTAYRFDDFCLSEGWGIRAGYASAKLLASVSRSRRAGMNGRIVLALTANPYFALDGVHPGTLLTSAATRLKLTAPFHIGLNSWYITSGQAASGVLKVRHGMIEEVGLASRQLTTGRSDQRRLLTSF